MLLSSMLSSTAGTQSSRAACCSSIRTPCMASRVREADTRRSAAAPACRTEPLPSRHSLVSTSVSTGHNWLQQGKFSGLAVAAEADAATGAIAATAAVTTSEPVSGTGPSASTADAKAAVAEAPEQPSQTDTSAKSANASPTDSATSATAAVSEQRPKQPARPVRPTRPKPHQPQRPKQQRHSADRHSEASAVPQGTPPPVPVPKEDIWFKHGDVILGRIVFSNSRGARVATLRDDRIIGYMPAQEGPYVLRQDDVGDGSATGDRSPSDIPLLPVGTVREFQVLKVPAGMEYYGKGPLLSARLVDLDLIWTRVEMAMQHMRETREVVRVQFQSLNDGGLMSRFMGLRLFLPLSHLHKPDPRAYLSNVDLKKKYIEGGPIEVALSETLAFSSRFVCSEALAVEYNATRKLEIGALVWGSVRRLEEFGAFIGIDDTRISGLLHVSNISRRHVQYPEDVFKIGDRVRSVILDIEDFSRVSMSTAELEENPGDMLTNPEKVYAGADEQVKVFLELQAEDDEAYAQQDAPRDSEILASGHY